jgi:hypothetical protein
MKTISMPVYNRPQYLEPTLASLSKNDWTGYKLFIAAEHGVTEGVMNLCKAIDWIDKEIFTSTYRLGCDKNTYRSICLPFASGSEFNIYWEDDVEASSGLRELADWYADYNDKKHACLCTESYTGRESPTNELRNFNAFNSHGFMCSRWQFETHLQPNWLKNKLSEDTCRGWDWNLMNYITKTPELNILAPMHAYSRHIGAIGTYCRREYFERSTQSKLVLCHDKHKEFYHKFMPDQAFA